MEFNDFPATGGVTGASAEAVRHRRTGVVLRLLRRFWVIALIWMLVSVPISFLIYVFFPPNYEAFSTLRTEPSGPDQFAEAKTVRSYLDTQVKMISSDTVLAQAIASPRVAALSMIRQCEDPKGELRKKMSVEIMDNGHMIRVALKLPDANQATTIVNSIVEAYMMQNTIFDRSVTKNLQETLKAQLVTLEKSLTETKNEMEKMIKEGKFKIVRPNFNPNPGRDDRDQAVQPAFPAMTKSQYENMLAQITRVENELIEAQAMLDTLERNAKKRAIERANIERSGKVDAQLDERIEEEFNNDPDVVALSDEIANTRAAHKQLGKLRDRWRELWEEKYPEILKRLRSGTGGDPAKEAATIADLRVKIEALKKKRDGYVGMLQAKLVESKKTSSEHFNAIMLNHELNSLLSKRDSVTRNLEQLKFEAEQDFRVDLQERASVAALPLNSASLTYMAVASLFVFCLILCLFLWQEIKADRAARRDPVYQLIATRVWYAAP
jgi:polysaccharide biosynthesis transport protein